MRDFELDPNGQPLRNFADYTCKELTELTDYLESFIYCMEEASNCYATDEDDCQASDIFCNLSELANDFKESLDSCTDTLYDLADDYNTEEF